MCTRIHSPTPIGSPSACFDVQYLHCDQTWRQHHGLEIGYCSNIQFDGLPNATCSADDIVAIHSRTAAYQAKKGTTNTDQCWRLHDGITEPLWSFVDSENPAVGVQVTYTNGDWCGAYGIALHLYPHECVRTKHR